MRKTKDYRRWEFDEDAEVSMEEQLSLEDHDYDHGRETPTSTTTFSQSNGILVTSHIHHHRKKTCRESRIREKIQVLCMSGLILTVGFVAGFTVGMRDFQNANSKKNNHSLSEMKQQLTVRLTKESSLTEEEEGARSFSKSISMSLEDEASDFYPPPSTTINVDNILQILKTMSQEVHIAGSPEGKSMAMAIRDLWRSYGLSVRVEQHKTLLSKATDFSYAEVIDENGATLFRTSEIGDDVNQPNSRPMIAFSPAADLNGTLIYCHYGRPDDFELLRSAKIPLNRSIALVRFGGPHPSKVAALASAYGIKGLLFYPDPQDYGPQLPSTAIRRSSLLTLGQMHEYQKHKSKLIIPAHTISFRDAEQLLRAATGPQWIGAKKVPRGWEGGFTPPYLLGGWDTGSVQIRLRIFNEPKTSWIYNVVAAIPGAWESDRYVIIGCSHDAWSYGAGEPGMGIALLSEVARSFSVAVQSGWKPRRSILFISWDANLFASSGVSHWLQDHHFEISTRTIAYMDLSRVLRGRQTLHVHSSPILRELARRAISRVMHVDSASQFGSPGHDQGQNGSQVSFASIVTSDESSFPFFGSLGIPTMKMFYSNSKGYDYPLFHTSFDTFENFVNSLDPSMKEAETLGKIIMETLVLLADSSVLPINVEDYVVEIQKAFGSFMAHYQEDLHRANLSIAYLQAAVMRLEVIGDNFRTEMHNRTVITPEHDSLPPPVPSPKSIKSKKALLHRIINDKLMQIDRTFLSRSSDVYKHQVLGFTSDMDEISTNVTGVASMLASFDQYFPKLKEALLCGRRAREREAAESAAAAAGIKETGDISATTMGSGINYAGRNIRGRRSRAREKKKHNRLFDTPVRDSGSCRDWHIVATQRIASLTRALDAASAVLQSPLLPEESE